MKALSYLTPLSPLLLAPPAALAAQAGAAAVSEPLTTDSLVSSLNPGGPIQTFPSTAVTTTTDTDPVYTQPATATETATPDGSSSSLGSESTTTTALHPSEPTGISGGTGTGTGSSASATTTPSSSEGAAFFRDGGSSKVALVVALGAGMLGWVAF